MLSIREKSQRGFADHQWLKTWHSFSFADYVDTRYNNFSVLRVINEDHIQTGFGFPAHPHKNMEIFTYVLAGTLQHKDSMGNETQLHAGEYQIMSAGTGIYHSEYSVHPTDDAHIYQIWMIPNKKGITPRYEQKPFADTAKSLLLSPDASGDSFRVHQDLWLWRYRFATKETQTLELNPERNYWLQMVRGKLDVNGESVGASDGIAVRNESSLRLIAETDSEFLLFDLPQE